MMKKTKSKPIIVQCNDGVTPRRRCGAAILLLLMTNGMAAGWAKTFSFNSQKLPCVHGLLVPSVIAPARNAYYERLSLLLV
jgi:hypothetical protein